MSVPENDAQALHAVLVKVNEHASNAHWDAAWPAALECEQINTIEFARRHAEVVGLYSGTLAAVHALPERARVRALGYAHLWWNAIIRPDQQWQSVSGEVLGSSDLDHLASTADLIASHGTLSRMSSDTNKLGELAEQCEEWISWLEDESESPIDSSPIRAALLLDLRHILWLIENAHLYGAARVAAAGQHAIGGMNMAGGAVPRAQKGTWFERIKSFGVVLAMISNLYNVAGGTYDVLEGEWHETAQLPPGPSSVPTAPAELSQNAGSETPPASP